MRGDPAGRDDGAFDRDEPLADGFYLVLEDPPLVCAGDLPEDRSRYREACHQGIVEDDRLASDFARAVVEHECEQHIIRLGLDPPCLAGLDESAEHRQRRSTVGRQDVELADHVLRLALVPHDEPVSRRPAVQPEQEQIAEAPPRQGIMDDLAVHLLPVELPQGQDLVQRHRRDIDRHRNLPARTFCSSGHWPRGYRSGRRRTRPGGRDSHRSARTTQPRQPWKSSGFGKSG